MLAWWLVLCLEDSLLGVQAELGVQDSDTDTGDMAYWRIRSAGMTPLTTGMSILCLDLLIASALAFCLQQRNQMS